MICLIGCFASTQLERFERQGHMAVWYTRVLHLDGTAGEMSNFYLNLGYDHSYSSMTSCMLPTQVERYTVKNRSRGQYLYIFHE